MLVAWSGRLGQCILISSCDPIQGTCGCPDEGPSAGTARCIACSTWDTARAWQLGALAPHCTCFANGAFEGACAPSICMTAACSAAAFT